MSIAHSTVNLNQAIQNLETLPTVPIIAQKILALDLDSDEGERAMIKLIEKDPLISGKIIGMANSPLFAVPKLVTSISDASMLLGITRVKTITLGIAVMSAWKKNQVGKLDVQALWLHSMAISLAARILARAMPANKRPLDDEIFLAGLLHDIGYMVLNHLDPKRSNDLHTRFEKETNRSTTAIEAELLEMNHCELGAELARFWKLPDSMVTVLRYHHDPRNEGAAEVQPLVGVINLAERILSSFGIFEHDNTVINPEEWQSLGIDLSRADGLIKQIFEQADEARQSASQFS